MPSPSGAKQQRAPWPPRGPARVLLVLDQFAIAELVKLTLNHGVYVVRTVGNVAEVETSLTDWQPHLVLADMDLNGLHLMELVVARPGPRLPVIGVTRRGDLKNKLAAFEAGVDDNLTIPFARGVARAGHRSLAPVLQRCRDVYANHQARRIGDRHPQPDRASWEFRVTPDVATADLQPRFFFPGLRLTYRQLLSVITGWGLLSPKTRLSISG